MFLQEKELKEKFWKSYNGSKRAVRYQFEFKLNDIKKALLQAEGNLPYVNKSWVVVPIEKKNLILDKYKNHLEEKKYIGVIGVEPGGRYSIIYQPRFKIKTYLHQEIIKVCVAGL